MVQEEVLDSLASDGLTVYAVWESILPADNERWAHKSAAIFHDPRVRNYWVGSDDLGAAFQPALHLEGGPAWDVYLLYGPGTGWQGRGPGAGPPVPAFYMHQLRALPDSLALDGPQLRSAIRKQLARRAQLQLSH